MEDDAFHSEELRCSCNGDGTHYRKDRNSMIEIILSDKAYENDVYPLVKAFYPSETIKIYEQGEAKVLQSRIASDCDTMLTLLMELEKDKIELSVTLRGESTVRHTLTLTEQLSKPQYKNAMKRFLYSCISGLTGRELPWGILTGIRPTKLVYDLIEQGEYEEVIYQHMKKEYLCSEEKIAMSLEIANRELKLLRDMDYQDGYSLYIGIPFCPSTCLYCSFTSYSVEKYSIYVDQYLQALEKEIRFAATCFPGRKLTTVYLGGGTPTTLTAEQLNSLLSLVRELFDFTQVKEFCVEAGRPDSITREKLEVLKKQGVDRISINPQSMQQRTLDLIGRKHTVTQVKEAFRLARETGHDNVNMDLILGLPGENISDVRDTLCQIKDLQPDSLTVHTLAVKRAARLNQEKESYAKLQATDVSVMLSETIRFAQENAYLPYYLYRQKNMADNLENIGYAKFGKEGLYNILIMEEKQTILALGAGGMSKFVFHQENRIERVDNVKSVTDYINRIDEMIERKRHFLTNNSV